MTVLTLENICNEKGILSNDIDPDILNYIRKLESENNTLRNFCERDHLTGLYNRNKYDTDLKNLVSEVDRTGKDLSLILVDLDHFKSVNDTYGHPEGDKVLKEAATCMSMTLRDYESDRVYRWGGEEFAILIPNSSLKEGISIAERIKENISNTIRLPSGNSITASLGVANYKDNAQTMDELERFADNALYEAKEHGRNKVEFYSPNILLEVTG